jgi:glutaredoxin-related protein
VIEDVRVSTISSYDTVDICAHGSLLSLSMSDQRPVGRDVEPVDSGTDGISFAVSCRPKLASIARTQTRADLYFATKAGLPLGINATAAASVRTSTIATDRTFAAAIDSTVTLRSSRFATRDKSPNFEIAMSEGYHPIPTISIRRGGGVVRSMTCRQFSA